MFSEPKATLNPERLLAVGDIHGHYEELVELLEKVNPDDRDVVVFLGDYIDRGPDSRKVLEHLLWFRDQHPNYLYPRQP